MKAKAFLPFLFLITIGLVLLDPLSALAAEPPSSSPFSPALIPSLTPAQAMTIQEAVRKGELTPEVRQLIESNPEWKKLLPPKWREELETEESGRELGLDNTMLQRLKERAEKEKKEKEEKKERDRAGDKRQNNPGGEWWAFFPPRGGEEKLPGRYHVTSF